MEEIVIDASVSGSWIIESEKTPDSEALLEGVINHRIDVIVPLLWIYEMINILKSCVIRKRLSREDAMQGVRTIQAIPVRTLHPDLFLQRLMFRLSVDHDISAYDASYIAIAEELSCRFLTTDNKLLSLGSHFPSITSLGEMPELF